MSSFSRSSYALLAVNLNTMIGAGIFVYPALIAAAAQSMGFLSFGAVFCIMLPLVLAIAQLAILHPTGAGGLYIYGKEALGNHVGILTSIIYFLAKALSCSIMIRIFVVNLLMVFPALSAIPLFVLRISALAFLLVLNLFGLRFGLRIQAGFVVLKLIPLLIVVAGGIFIFNSANLSLLPTSFDRFVSTLPLALYPMMGFETCCAVGHISLDAKRMAYAVVGSFLFVTLLYMLMQFFLFAAVGTGLFGSLTPLTLFFNALFKGAGQLFFTLLGVLAIMISALGSAYSILYSASWYPFAIGKEFKSSFMTTVNRYGSPVAALIIHTAIIALFLLLPDKMGALGRLSVFGCLVIYATMACALLAMYKKRSQDIKLPYWVAILSLVSCGYIAFSCIKDLL